MMATDILSPYASLRREVAERLCSFFVAAPDGRAMSLDAGAAVASSQGPHRERNEDRCAIVRFRFGSVRTDLRLGIVCDGMGGMAKGAEAAASGIASFIAAFATIEADCSLKERLDRSCRFANRAVFDFFGGEAGTTLTAIAFANQARCAVHVGDSRLYGIDEARRVELLSQDDTVSGAVNAHMGQRAEDDLDNRLLQFVGIGEAMSPHLIDVTHDSGHELWLITTDGAHSVGRRALNGICGGSRNPYDLVRKLVFVSEAIDTEDNSTALCIRSGYVKSAADEHEGLTIQITAPHGNLEIWLPPSVVQIAATTVPRTPIAADAPAALTDPSSGEARQTARQKSGSTPRAQKKAAPKRRKRVSKSGETVMDFIFDASGGEVD